MFLEGNAEYLNLNNPSNFFYYIFKIISQG